MKSFTRNGALALGVSTVALLASGAMAQSADEPELRRVLISTGGVGYFEFEAQLDGASELMLDIRLDQVDDVLKSLVVFDDEGVVDGVSLPGQQPLREVFRDLPFGPEALDSLAALLDALTGSEIRIEGPRPLQGRLIAVTETVILGENGVSTTAHRLSLLTDSGLRQAILEEADSVSFVDPQLQAQIDGALVALAENQRQDRRTLRIGIEGDADRTVRLAYVVEMPLWKSAYRLTLADESDAPSILQGWAVLENLSGQDWNGIELTLASGNPVTFRQSLYDAYFVDRPEAPVEVLGRLLPDVDEGGVEYESAMAPMVGDIAVGRAAEAQQSFAPPPPPSAAPAPPLAQLTAAETDQATAQVLFRFSEPVTVASGDSVMLPILTQAAPMERASLYQPGTHATHPLATVRITNEEDSGLPPGILTLFERMPDGRVSYLGDARLSPLPAGEDRLVSFALDQDVTIDREQQQSQRLVRASLTNGVLEQIFAERLVTTYRIEGPANADRMLILEHPRPRGGYELIGEEGEVELTPTAFRIPLQIAAGETVTHEVILERQSGESLRLDTLDRDRIIFYAENDRLDPEIRAAFEALAQRLAEVQDLEAAVRETEALIAELVANQERIRENLASVPQDSDLYQRYLAELQSEEDRLAELRDTLRAQREAAETARREFTEFARALTV